MQSRVTTFISRRWSVPESRLHVRIDPVHGGLESRVALAHIAGPPEAGLPVRLVIKELRRELQREAAVYDALWGDPDTPPNLRLLGSETDGDHAYLYLEQAQPVSPWPWADPSIAAAVCRELARLHDRTDLPQHVVSWDYERELADSARETLAFAAVAHDASGRRYWRRLGDLRRVVSSLPAIRSGLLARGSTVIHGDVHSGNVVLRRGHPNPEVVLIDWARTRVGSPSRRSSASNDRWMRRLRRYARSNVS